MLQQYPRKWSSISRLILQKLGIWELAVSAGKESWFLFAKVALAREATAQILCNKIEKRFKKSHIPLSTVQTPPLFSIES